MKLAIRILIVLFLAQTRINAQNLKIEVSSGIGNYSMKGMKKMMSEKFNWFGKSKIVHDFPPFPFFRVMILNNDENSDTGLSITLNSTGSRRSMVDYSGSYMLDNVVSSTSFGFYHYFCLHASAKIDWGITSEGGMVFSKYRLSETVEVGTESSKQSISVYNNGLFLNLGLKANYSYKKIKFCSYINYNRSFDKLDRNQILDVNHADFDYTGNWNGLRIGVGISYIFEGI